MKLIRGNRFLQALIEDSTYQGLYRNIETNFLKTKKRQHAVGDVTTIRVKYLPFHEQQALQVDGQAQSHGHTYQPTVQFFYIEYETNLTPTNITFTGIDNKQYHVQPIKLGINNVKVRCTCLDFYYRFANYNFKDNSLYGPKAPPYQTKGKRPPVNPKQVPGLCKHIIKLIEELERTGLVIK